MASLTNGLSSSYSVIHDQAHCLSTFSSNCRVRDHFKNSHCESGQLKNVEGFRFHPLSMQGRPASRAMGHNLDRPALIVSSVESKLEDELTSISGVIESQKYEAWLLDQFGVLHDGKNAYPGAIAALENLAKSGARLVLISNSSKRSQVTKDKLPGIGFDPSLFAGIVTSGELTHEFLLKREDPWFRALGRKCLHFTWSTRGDISLEGLDLQVVEAPEEADFILAHGTEALGLADGTVKSVGLDDFEDFMARAAKLPHRIPMIVANPDMVTVEVRALMVMPGTLGLKYEQLGCEVKWMGKPDPIIYKAAMKIAGTEPNKTVAVGDSLFHDIKGANQAGIDSVFVAGGIHAKELAMEGIEDDPDPSALNMLIKEYNVNPTYSISRFTW